MNALQKKYSLAIRWFHWINFPLLFLMICSGLMIYWANDVYRIGVGNATLVHFFPNWFYQLFSIPQQLAVGMAWHFFFMWFFAMNGIAYVCYLLLSGEWHYLWPDRRTFKDAISVSSGSSSPTPHKAPRTLYELHLRDERPAQGT